MINFKILIITYLMITLCTTLEMDSNHRYALWRYICMDTNAQI